MASSCPACGKPLRQKPDERPGRFAKRISCGRACSAVLAVRRRWKDSKLLPQRACWACKSVLVMRPGESLKNFRDRRTCGAEPCREAYRSQRAKDATRLPTEKSARQQPGQWPEGMRFEDAPLSRHPIIGRLPLVEPNHSRVGNCAVMCIEARREV